jgi:hypothetical protein
VTLGASFPESLASFAPSRHDWLYRSTSIKSEANTQKLVNFLYICTWERT